MSAKKSKTIITVVVLAAIIAALGFHIYKSRIPNRNFQRLADARPEYEAAFNKEMQAELIKSLSLEDHPEFAFDADTVSVRSKFRWEWSARYDWQEWECTCDVDLTGPSSFLNLNNQERKQVLTSLDSQCKRVMYAHYDSFEASLQLEGEPDLTGNLPGVSVIDGWLSRHSSLHFRLHIGNSVFEPSSYTSGYYQDDRYIEANEANKIENKVPYVGMSETLIRHTSLGEPDPVVRHNTASDGHGGHISANIYDFKENGWTIFTARCVKGYVTEVWDYRDRIDTSKPRPSPTHRIIDTDDDKDDDPYDVYDYTDPEDFYYDYEDEFYDYEDAEDYFYEHVG